MQHTTYKRKWNAKNQFCKTAITENGTSFKFFPVQTKRFFIFKFGWKERAHRVRAHILQCENG